MEIKYPITQIYDGNYYNPRRAAAGHLFPAGSDVALCGRKKSIMGAPVKEKEYSSTTEVPSRPWHGNGRHCEKCTQIIHHNNGLIMEREKEMEKLVKQIQVRLNKLKSIGYTLTDIASQPTIVDNQVDGEPIAVRILT